MTAETLEQEVSVLKGSDNIQVGRCLELLEFAVRTMFHLEQKLESERAIRRAALEGKI